MELIKGFGLPFPAEYSSCSNLSPRSFSWTTGDGNIHIYIDNRIFEGLETPRHEAKFGWLCESREIATEIYNAVYQNPGRYRNKYAGIFTCEESLISMDPDFFLYAPPGSNLPWTKPDEMQMYVKEKLCSMICSPKARTDGHRFRLDVADKLRNSIDLFGGAHGSPRIGDGSGPNGDWWRSKLPALKDYMFSIVFENAVYDKYYTEKITDCFATGTIPVYWGSEKVCQDFNKDGIIFFNQLEDIRDLTYELYLSKTDSILDNLERAKRLESADDIIYRTIKNRT
jgi:hypothetical protein